MARFLQYGGVLTVSRNTTPEPASTSTCRRGSEGSTDSRLARPGSRQRRHMQTLFHKPKDKEKKKKTDAQSNKCSLRMKGGHGSFDDSRASHCREAPTKWEPPCRDNNRATRTIRLLCEASEVLGEPQRSPFEHISKIIGSAPSLARSE